MRWKEVELNKICDLQNGYAFKSKDYVEFSTTLNCRMSNIRPNGNFDITYSPKYLPESHAVEFSKYLLKDGDLIIAMTDMANEPKILGVPTLVKTNGNKLLLNQRVGKLLFEEDIINKSYLQYALNRNSIKKYYTKFAGGGLQLNLGKKELLSVKIPLPPLPIQKKIAAILDAADDYRQKTKALIEKYDQLIQSIFLDMFGDPVQNEKGWEKGVVIDGSRSIVPTRDKPKSFTGKTPWIKTDDLNHLAYTSVSKNNIGLNDEEILNAGCRIIPKNSVVMTCVGDLGVVSIVEQDIVMNQQLHAFVCDDSILNPIFLMHVLSYQKPYYYKMATNTTVPYLNKTKCNNTPCIYPPLKLQSKFEEICLSILEEKMNVSISINKTENLFQSLLQKAFKGELTN